MEDACSNVNLSRFQQDGSSSTVCRMDHQLLHREDGHSGNDQWKY